MALQQYCLHRYQEFERSIRHTNLWISIYRGCYPDRPSKKILYNEGTELGKVIRTVSSTRIISILLKDNSILEELSKNLTTILMISVLNSHLVETLQLILDCPPVSKSYPVIAIIQKLLVDKFPIKSEKLSLVLNHKRANYSTKEKSVLETLIMAERSNRRGLLLKILLNETSVPCVNEKTKKHIIFFVIDMICSEGEYPQLRDTAFMRYSLRNTRMQYLLEDFNFMINNGIYVNVKNEVGNSVLLECLERHSSLRKNGVLNILVSLLLRHENIDVNLKNIDNESPLLVCTKHALHDEMELLLNHRAIDINIVDAKGKSSFMYIVPKVCSVKISPKPPVDTEDWASAISNAKHFVSKHDEKFSVFVDSSSDGNSGDERIKADKSQERWLQHIFAILTNEDFDVNLKNNDGNTVLMQLVANINGKGRNKKDSKLSNEHRKTKRYLKIQKYLIDWLIHHPKSNFDLQNKKGKTLFMLGLQVEQYNLIKNILKHRTHIFRQDNEGNNALHHAVSFGQTGAVADLLPFYSSNSKANTKNFKGETALIISCKASMNLKIISDLLKVDGIDVNATDKRSHTAMNYVILSDDFSMKVLVLKMLVTDKRISNINYQDPETGCSPIHILLQEHEVQSVIELLTIKNSNKFPPVDFSLCDREGSDVWDAIITFTTDEIISENQLSTEQCKTMIHLAVTLPNIDVNKTYRYHQAIMHKAALHKCSLAWQVFLQTEVDVNIQDESGNTCLMYALEKFGENDIMNVLKKKDVDVSLQNMKGEMLNDIGKECSNDSMKLVIQAIVCQNKYQLSPEEILKPIALPKLVHIMKEKLKSEPCFHPERKDQLMGILEYFQADLTQNKWGQYGESYSMSELHRKKLQKLNAYLCREMELHPLLSYLYGKEVITEDNMEDVESEKIRSKKCQRLLLILPHRGPDAFKHFVDALRDQDQLHIAEKLERFLPDEVCDGTEIIHGNALCGRSAGTEQPIIPLPGLPFGIPLIPINIPDEKQLQIRSGNFNPPPAKKKRT